MAEALPPEVERLASFGRALEGTVDITQEDIDEVPSDEGSPSALCKPRSLTPSQGKIVRTSQEDTDLLVQSLYKTSQGNQSE